MHLFRNRWIVVALGAALALGACSESSVDPADDPQAAFEDALDSLQDYEGVTLTFTVQSDEASLEALAAEDPMADLDVVNQVLNSSITISSRGESAEDTQAEFLVNVDGNEDAVQLRVIGTSLYARADVRELVEAFGGDTAELDAVAQQAAGSGFDFIGPALEGEWIGMENLDEFAQQLTGQPLPEPDEEQAAKLQEQLAGVLKDNVTVTSAGSDVVGDHVVVQVPIRQTAQELLDIFQEFSQLPAGTALPPDALAEIPEGDLELDAWISDGQIVQFEIDFVKAAEEFGDPAPEGVERLALRLEIAEFTDEIEAPEGATLIDPQQIFQGIFGGLGGLGAPATPSGGTIPELGILCSDLEGLSEADVRAFLEGAGRADLIDATKQACPELFD